jgi:hypothetical protein
MYAQKTLTCDGGGCASSSGAVRAVLSVSTRPATLGLVTSLNGSLPCNNNR